MLCVLWVLIQKTLVLESWKWVIYYKQYIVIQFLVKSDEKPWEIFQKLHMVYRDNCISKTSVLEWAKRFKKGRESVEEHPRDASFVTNSTDATDDCLRTLITCDGRLSIWMLLHNVTKVLTHEQNKFDNRYARICCPTFGDGRNLSRIITGGENWIFDYDPETRRPSQRWVEKVWINTKTAVKNRI